MSINRPPAIKRAHPADSLPGRPSSEQAPPPPPAEPARHAPTELAERLIEQHNVRIRPSTKARLSRAVDKLRYETGDRTISAASITDRAITEYLDRHGC